MPIIPILAVRTPRAAPLRVTNRHADHAGTCGRTVGVPKVDGERVRHGTPTGLTPTCGDQAKSPRDHGRRLWGSCGVRVRTGVGARHGEPGGDHPNSGGADAACGAPTSDKSSPRWVSPSAHADSMASPLLEHGADHPDRGGHVVGHHHIAGLRAGRGQPVRVTSRDADHTGTCGRKVGVPKVGVPFPRGGRGGCPLPKKPIDIENDSCLNVFPGGAAQSFLLRDA